MPTPAQSLSDLAGRLDFETLISGLSARLVTAPAFADEYRPVQLLLRITPPPGGHKPMVDALRSVMLPARLERGCTRAQILRDVDAADSIDYLEEWQSPEDLRERLRSASFGRLLALMEAAPSEPSLEFRDVSGIHGLEYVAAVREPSSKLPEGHERNG